MMSKTETSAPLGQRIWVIDCALLLLGAVFCVAFFGFLSMDLRLPVRAYNDHIFMLVQIKKIIEGSGWRWEPHLGFPGVQDQLRFPLFDFSYRLINEILAIFTDNIFLIANLTYIVGIPIIFGFSYYALRAIDLSPFVALVCGISCTATLFVTFRGYQHDYLALYYSVPLGGVLSLLLARREGAFMAMLGDKITLLSLVVLASSGLYYAFFACMFLLLTALAKALAVRRLAPIGFAVAFSVLVLVLLAVLGYGTAIPELLGGQLVSVPREPSEQVVLALFMGTGLHVFADFGILGQKFGAYDQYMTALTSGQFLEWPGIALTLIIFAAPVTAFALGSIQSTRAPWTRKAQTVVLCAMLISFGLIFAASGGLGFIFNFLVTPVIRAQGRILPFLTFFAAVIAALGLQRLWDLRNTAIWYAASLIFAAILIGCCLPAMGSMATKQRGYLASPQYADLTSISAMLAAKDQAGLQAILQLPYAGWPELPNIGKFPLYNHQLPYLLDAHGSTTKWSYGLTPNDPVFQKVTMQLGMDDLHDDLAPKALGLGFDGVLIEKTAYSTQDLATIQGHIRPSTSVCRIFEDASRVLFSLRPECSPF